MRRLRYAVAMSLDGYIAGPKGEADWIVMDPEINFAEIWGQFDTLLMGRRTFEAAAGYGGSYGGFKIVVFSRTLKASDHPELTLVSGDAAETVARIKKLKKEKGKDLWLFGGGELFRSLLNLGLVDTVEVGLIPVLLGEGIPLLPSPADRARLTLTGHRVYKKTGTVGLEYAVKRPRKRQG